MKKNWSRLRILSSLNADIGESPGGDVIAGVSTYPASDTLSSSSSSASVTEETSVDELFSRLVLGATVFRVDEKCCSLSQAELSLLSLILLFLLIFGRPPEVFAALLRISFISMWFGELGVLFSLSFSSVDDCLST